MMRHAMGIRCVFFPEETGHDLKFTEVNGGFQVTFPTAGSAPGSAQASWPKPFAPKNAPSPPLFRCTRALGWVC